jgi:8-oxo-dGTP pyrophosphatase MutT (NUDIX family)
MEHALEHALRSLVVEPDAGATREAAVAVVLAGTPLEVLLIQRAEDPADAWSGHMALPGGRRDPLDADLHATAVRETREEVAVELGDAPCWGRLPGVRAVSRRGPSGMVIAPYVFRLPERPVTRANAEVADVLWVRLADLGSGALDTELDYSDETRRLRLPAWRIEGRLVWGLTHRILSDLLLLGAARTPRGSSA